MNIEKKQDELMKNIEFLEVTKAAQREQQIEKALQNKFGKLSRKIY